MCGPRWSLVLPRHWRYCEPRASDMTTEARASALGVFPVAWRSWSWKSTEKYQMASSFPKNVLRILIYFLKMCLGIICLVPSNKRSESWNWRIIKFSFPAISFWKWLWSHRNFLKEMPSTKMRVKLHHQCLKSTESPGLGVSRALGPVDLKIWFASCKLTWPWKTPAFWWYLPGRWGFDWRVSHSYKYQMVKRTPWYKGFQKFGVQVPCPMDTAGFLQKCIYTWWVWTSEPSTKK